MLAKKLNAGSSWKAYCGSPAAVRNYACYPNRMAIGTVFTSVSLAGVIMRSGKPCISILPTTPIWKMSSSTARWSEPILVLRGPQKNGGQSEQALGRSRGGFSTKIQVNVDGLGNPLRFLLTGGQRHDVTQAEGLIADRSYDSDDFLRVIRDKEAQAVIPPRKNRKESREYDQHLYKERHLVECFINKIKHYRRILSRFEKLDKRFLGFLSFVGALIWLR